jgi:hypothetical protein
VPQQQHEAVQRPHAASHPDVTDVRPINLRLFARECLDPHVDFARHRRAVREHETPQSPQTPRVAAVDEHVVDARCHQARIALEGLDDVAAVGVEYARSRLLRLRLGTERPDHSLHHVGVDAKLRRDRPPLPVLGKVESTDLDLGFPLDRHRAHSHVSWRRSRKSPPGRCSVLALRRRSARSPRAATPTS